MRVTAMLAWYDEPAELLAQAVTAAAVVADKVVAVDGGYRLRPNAKNASPAEQEAAIYGAARAADLDAEVLVPQRVWEGQVEKRDWMLRHAAASADWVTPLDADWVFTGDRHRVRGELGTCEQGIAVLDIPFWSPWDGSRHLAEIAPTTWHLETAGQLLFIPVLMRALPEMRLEKHHWWYSGLWHGERMSLWGHENVMPEAPRRRVESGLMIEHRWADRDPEQLEANRAFCAERDRQVAATGTEA